VALFLGIRKEKKPSTGPCLQEVEAAIISRQWVNEGGKVVSPTPLLPRELKLKTNDNSEMFSFRTRLS
jgi:hypothetical protein